MRSSWPDGVTSYEDMRSYAKTLFGEQCTIEDLLREVPEFAKEDGWFLVCVKGACKEKNWVRWPGLIEKAMAQTVAIHGTADQKGKKGRQRQRQREQWRNLGGTPRVHCESHRETFASTRYLDHTIV